MCEYCLRPECPPRCPGYKDKTIGNCEICGCDIVPNDVCYKISGMIYCEDCINDSRTVAEDDYE